MNVPAAERVLSGAAARLGAAALAFVAPTAWASSHLLPAKLDHGRYVLEITTPQGLVSRWYTDSGGGLFVHAEAATRLGLAIVEAPDGEGGTARYAALPDSTSVPIPPPASHEGRLFVYAPDAAERGDFEATYDGMLGQEWHAGRRLVFDYPAGTLRELDAGDPLPTSAPTLVLGFKRDEKGERQLNFARLTATIDGQPVDLLFDTGATVNLTASAAGTLGGEAGERATSFVIATLFDAWRAKHPDWRIVESAEQGSGNPMLEVPVVELAGVGVGPVWFTRRPDKNFHEYMSQWMDRRVDGALGGNAFATLRLTVDYPAARLYVEKP